MEHHNIPILRPLQIVELLILAVLSEGPSHGYGLVQELDERLEGRMKIRPGNIYRVLDRLTDAALLEEAEPPDEIPGEARRMKRGAERSRGFSITEAGRERLDSETRFRARALSQTPAVREALVGAMRPES